MEHFGIYPLTVISVKEFTYKNKVLFKPVAVLSESLQEIFIQTICNIKSETVNVKFPDPACYTIKNMIYNLRIIKIKLYKIIMTFPALIPQTVIVITVSSEVNVKPILIGRVLTVFKNILKCPEASSDMIEYTVKNYFDSCAVKLGANLLKILICTQSAINFLIISGVVAVRVRFKNRRKINSIRTKLIDMRYPVNDFENSAFLNYDIQKTNREVILWCCIDAEETIE